MATTPLRQACIRSFLIHSKGIADCGYTAEDHTRKSAVPTRYLICALTNQLSDTCPLEGTRTEELVQQCADAAIDALKKCSQLIKKAQRRPRVRDGGFMGAQMEYADDLKSAKIGEELRLLVRNLSYRGFVPVDDACGKAVAAFVADIDICEECRYKTMIELWATICSNMAVKCGIDTSTLKRAISELGYRKLGIDVAYADT